jgi:hypothetical protein
LTSVWQGMKYILQTPYDALCAFWRYIYVWVRLSVLDSHITYQEIFCHMNGQNYVVIVSAEIQETSWPTNCLLCNAPVFNHIFLISEKCESLSCYCLGKTYYWISYFWSETIEFLWTLLEDNHFWGHITVGFVKIAWKSCSWLSHSLPSEGKWHEKQPKFQLSIFPAIWLHESPLPHEMEL